MLAHYPLDGDGQASRTLEMLIRDEDYGWEARNWASWQSRTDRGAVFL